MIKEQTIHKLSDIRSTACLRQAFLKIHFIFQTGKIKYISGIHLKNISGMILNSGIRRVGKPLFDCPAYMLFYIFR